MNIRESLNNEDTQATDDTESTTTHWEYPYVYVETLSGHDLVM